MKYRVFDTDAEAQATERWAIPSPDDTGVEPEPDWWPAVLI